MPDETRKRLTGPLNPNEVRGHQYIPWQVWTAFGDLISQKLVNGQARVTQPEVVGRALDLFAAEPLPEVEVPEGVDARTHYRRLIFSNGWLNVEDHYRKLGWKVEYDKPAYNEDYDAYFIFAIG